MVEVLGNPPDFIYREREAAVPRAARGLCRLLGGVGFRVLGRRMEEGLLGPEWNGRDLRGLHL